MKKLIALALVLGCGGATSAPAKSRPAPTEADACERYCTTLGDCRISQPNCLAACAVDQKKFRNGFHPSLVACLERELERCELREVVERRQVVAICFSAVLEAYARDDAAIGKIVHAVCTREARCAPDPEPKCEEMLREKLKSSPQSKALAVARPELITTIADCVEKSGCSDADPIETCTHEGP